MLLSPRRPSGPGWVRLPLPQWIKCDKPHEFWQHDSGICAVSIALIIDDATDIGQHVMYNLALTMLGQRPCTEDETLWALNEFRFVEPLTLH